jgi:ferric-dicitrate binding protein FerR (iron transport regulator)
MPTSDPRPPGEDRSDGERPSTRGRRGRAVVGGTFLAALAIVLAVLLLVPQCGQAVQDTGSAVDRSPVVEQADGLQRG